MWPGVDPKRFSQVASGAGRSTVTFMAREERMLTTAEAAARLGISRKTLAKYVADGLIKPTVRLPSGHMRWELDDIKRQLAEQPPDQA